jgi:hypothetical protein
LETGLSSSNLHNHFLFTVKETATHMKHFNSKDRCDKQRGEIIRKSKEEEEV